MSDPEFEAARRRKIAEIRRTGKTWQWPDTVRHRKWSTGHKVMAGWLLLNLVLLAWLAWWLAS